MKWRIANVTIPNKLVLAPMEGVNCASFRVLCKEYGAGLIYSDMVDTKQFLEILKENNDDEELTVRKVINPQKTERPLVIQLGSGEVDDLAHVAQVVSKYADLVDLNHGCPLGPMLGRKGGAYLMKHPQKLEKMFSALKDNSSVPVTGKIRSGWSDDERNGVEIAQLLEHLGAAAVAVHARTRKQRYMARADWNMIRDVKEAVSVPVIGNGDVLRGSHAVTMLGQTKCDAVMIARGAQGNPEIFSQAKLALLGERYDESGFADKKKSFFRFLKLYGSLESRSKVSEVVDHAGWWVNGLSNANDLRAKFRRCKSIQEVKKVWE